MNHPFLGTPILGTPPGYQPVDVSGFVHCQRSSLGFVLVEGQVNFAGHSRKVKSLGKFKGN